MSKAPTFEALRAEYARLWAGMVIRPAKVEAVDNTARRLLRTYFRYQAVSKATGVPAALIMAIHERESGARFDRHLHNGDPLTARTVQVPAGRPKVGDPPFTWEASAIDALKYQGLDKVVEWNIERACYALELYNGLGYRNRGLRSPYLWGATNQQQPGKYVADGRFDPSAVDQQIGACAVLYRLLQLEPGLSFGKGALMPPPPDIEPPPRHPDSVSVPTPSGIPQATVAGTVIAVMAGLTGGLHWKWIIAGVGTIAAIGIVAFIIKKLRG